MDAERIWHLLDGTPLHTCGGADPNSYDKEKSSCQPCLQEPYPGRSHSSSEAIDVELSLYPWLAIDQHSGHHWSFKTRKSLGRRSPAALNVRFSHDACLVKQRKAWPALGKAYGSKAC